MGDGTGCDNMTAIIVRLDRFLPDEATSTAQKRPLPLEDSTDESHEVAQGNELFLLHLRNLIEILKILFRRRASQEAASRRRGSEKGG